MYQIKDLRPSSSYLEIWITRDHTTWTIWINQQAYIENALKRFELLDANSTNTTLPAGIHLEKSEEPVTLNTKTYYQLIIRTLIYATDGPPHQIHLYILLFLLFHYFLYIVNPPLRTPTLMPPHVITLTLTWHLHSLIWWTHVLQFTCFISILSIPNVHPPMVRPIMSPRTVRSGTYYSFASDEPYAHFLVCYSYLTCLYLPFTPDRRATQFYPYEFPPEFKLSTHALHHTALTLHHFALYHTALQSHHLYPTPHLKTIPYPPDHTLRAP